MKVEFDYELGRTYKLTLVRYLKGKDLIKLLEKLKDGKPITLAGVDYKMIEPKYEAK